MSGSAHPNACADDGEILQLFCQLARFSHTMPMAVAATLAFRVLVLIPMPLAVLSSAVIVSPAPQRQVCMCRKFQTVQGGAPREVKSEKQVWISSKAKNRGNPHLSDAPRDSKGRPRCWARRTGRIKYRLIAMPKPLEGPRWQYTRLLCASRPQIKQGSPGSFDISESKYNRMEARECRSGPLEWWRRSW